MQVCLGCMGVLCCYQVYFWVLGMAVSSSFGVHMYVRMY